MARGGSASVTQLAELPALGGMPMLAPVREAVIEVPAPSPERSVLHIRSYSGEQMAEHDVAGPAPSLVAVGPDERRVALVSRTSDGADYVVQIVNVRDGSAISVTVPPRVDAVAWTQPDELLVVGRSGGLPWGQVIQPRRDELLARAASPALTSPDAEPPRATPVALEHAPSENVSRIHCATNRLIAVISSGGSLPDKLTHFIDLLRLSSEFPPRAVHQIELSCPFQAPAPDLARDGRHLLMGDLLGGSGAVRLDDVVNGGDAARRLETEGAQILLANGDCVVGQRVLGETVSAWRSTRDGLQPWANWQPTGERVEVRDVVTRGARADVLVRGRAGALLVFRLPDPDLVDVESGPPERRRRALRSLAERRDPQTAEPLAGLLGGKDPVDGVLAAEALAAIGGDALDAVVRRLGAMADSELDPLLGTLANVPGDELQAAVRRCWAGDADARTGAVRLLHRRRDLDGGEILVRALRTGAAALRVLAADAIDLATAPDAVLDLIAAVGSRSAELAASARQSLRRYLIGAGGLAAGADIDVLSADTREVQAVLEAGRAASDELSMLDALADAVVRAGRSGADVLNALDALAGAEQYRATALALAILLSDRLKGSDPAVAARLLERAIDLSSPADLDVPTVHWRVQLQRARLCGPPHSAPGDRAARGWLRGAMDCVDRSWSQLLGDPSNPHFFAEKAELYDEAMVNELRLANPAAAVDVLERAKTRYLVDLIARRHDPRVRALEPIDELFWELVGAPRPAIGRRRPRAPAVGGPPLGGVTMTTRIDPDAPLPQHLAELRAQPNALGRGVLDSLWELIARFPWEPAERVTRAKEVLEEVDAVLVRAPDVPGGKDVGYAAEVRGSYLNGARALLAIDDSYWALNEYSDRWLAEYLRDPEGPEGHTLAALREAIAYVTEREPVSLVVPPGGRDEPEADSPTTRAALAFEPLPPSGAAAAQSSTSSGAAEDAGRLRLSSRRRWEEIERLARGETAGFREAAERLLEEPGLGLIQFAVTGAGTVVLVAAGGAALGTRGLPQLAGWGGPVVFTSAEITAGWLADALSGRGATSWLTAYRRRDRNPERWEEVTDALLAKLYGELFARPREWLRARAVDRLLVVPHRGLHQQPLGAWFTQSRRGPRRYVLDDFDLYFAPSLSLHEVCARRAPDAGRSVDQVLVVAPPGRRLALSGVDALALPSSARTLRDEDASVEEWSRAVGGADLCHYQGHAAYRWEQPLESELTVAGPPLTLGDLFDDALEMPHVHAVTLSGCETTMTALDPADEWLGLAAGFTFAGAPVVLSTHWAVLELPASMLVERYYRELRAGRRPSAALGIAQRWLRDATRGDWEGFLRRVAETGAMSQDDRERLMQDLPRRRRARPFAAPVWWGAHTVAGLDRPLRWSSPTDS